MYCWIASSSCIKCNLGHLSYAYFGFDYADDVNLRAPSVDAPWDFITAICENFAQEYHVIYN